MDNLNDSDLVYNNYSDWNVDDYLNRTLASEQAFPMHILAPISVVYVLIFITGMVDNVCTCIAIIRNSKEIK